MPLARLWLGLPHGRGEENVENPHPKSPLAEPAYTPVSPTIKPKGSKLHPHLGSLALPAHFV